MDCRSQIVWAEDPDPRGEQPIQLEKGKQAFSSSLLYKVDLIQNIKEIHGNVLLCTLLILQNWVIAEKSAFSNKSISTCVNINVIITINIVTLVSNAEPTSGGDSSLTGFMEDHV